MQQQPLVPAKFEGQETPRDERGGPVELDLDILDHVAGGDGEALPKKYW